MDRQHLNNEIQVARDELQRLRDERAKLSAGDREGGARFRGLIATAAADLADLQAELKEFDANEASTARQAERASGRATAAAAIKATDESTKLWATLEKQLGDARVTARALAAQGHQVAEQVKAALRAHGDGLSLHSKLSLLIPPAAGSDTGTIEAVAAELKGLIDSLPGAHRITSEWLLPNHYAYTKATPGPTPSLLDARAKAAETLRESLRDVCAEPRIARVEIAA